jgi:hypothetical protein
MDKKTAVDELRRQIGAFLRGETEFSAFSRNYVDSSESVRSGSR